MSCTCDHADARLQPYREALAAALSRVPTLGTEVVAGESADGRILREPLVADRDLPACTRSRMDGYAVRAGEITPGARLPVHGTIHAGDPATMDVPAGACVKVATGAPIPPGLDAVIEHERSDRSDPVTFTIEDVQPGRCLHAGGADARAGETLVESGTRLRAAHLGLAAMVGATTLEVARLPRAIVVSSGDELVPAEATPEAHQVRDSNGPMIAATMRALGCPDVTHVHLPDDPDATRALLASAIETRELLVTIGGISAGERDFIRSTLTSLGITWDVSRANIKPGRPVHVGRAESGGAIACCLPGNPVSALVCAHLFVRPILAAMTGRTDDPAWTRCTLGADVGPDAVRWSYRPVAIDAEGRANVPAWQGSGDLAHLAGCHGIIELPPGETAHAGGQTFGYLSWGDG